MQSGRLYAAAATAWFAYWALTLFELGGLHPVNAAAIGLPAASSLVSCVLARGKGALIARAIAATSLFVLAFYTFVWLFFPSALVMAVAAGLAQDT